MTLLKPCLYDFTTSEMTYSRNNVILAEPQMTYNPEMNVKNKRQKVKNMV